MIEAVVLLVLVAIFAGTIGFLLWNERQRQKEADERFQSTCEAFLVRLKAFQDGSASLAEQQSKVMLSQMETITGIVDYTKKRDEAIQQAIYATPQGLSLDDIDNEWLGKEESVVEVTDDDLLTFQEP